MRLFVGIPVPESVQTTLGRLVTHLRPTAQIKWSPVYNLHITTKFIGEWPEDRLDQLKAALSSLSRPKPFTLRISGLGWLPNPHHPRTFFAAIQDAQPLHQLNHAVEDALVPLGIAKEDRPYNPHLTLARIKQESLLNHLKKAVADLESVEFGTFDVDSYHLYHSELGPAGSVYTSLTQFPFTAE